MPEKAVKYSKVRFAYKKSGKTKRVSSINVPKKRKIGFNFNTDRMVARGSMLALLAYIILFYDLQAKGFHLGRFSIAYAAIIIPIWVIDGAKSLFETFIPSHYRNAKEDLSKVTVVIASKDGEPFIKKTLRSLSRRFPADRIIVASNGSTDTTVQIAKEAGVRYLDIAKPVGKVRAINAALKYVKTPYVLMMDDDTLIGRAKIPTGLLDEGYEAVAFRVLIKTSTWITYFQMYEYLKSTDLGKRYHNRCASVQNISGAVGLFNIKELKRQIKIHTGEFAGEDLQRTLLIHLAAQSKGVILARSTVYTYPPDNFIGLYRQRVFAWYPGLYSNFANYLRLIYRRHVPWTLRADSFYNCILVLLFDIVRILALPILIFYPWYFVVMYVIYVALEFFAHLKTKFRAPFWVILLFPLYGTFGIMTRFSAFALFLYKRLVVKISRAKLLDDYRYSSQWVRMGSVIVVVTLISAILLINADHQYSSILTGLKP